jgi:hypothetical protein
MVYVRLAKDWSDGDGTVHAAGTMVDVDAATLAELEADGTVAASGDDEDWPGPTASTDAWPGPTGGGGTESWPGPTA